MNQIRMDPWSSWFPSDRGVRYLHSIPRPCQLPTGPVASVGQQNQPATPQPAAGAIGTGKQCGLGEAARQTPTCLLPSRESQCSHVCLEKPALYPIISLGTQVRRHPGVWANTLHCRWTTFVGNAWNLTTS